ncbi:hypothetical protein QQF64_005933 [Cirrhinus molitorella]|uniref:Uncharacterized protein n=1 Tax=Cirrhinus molitorella TaxID=172907 RepID=A0ABR3MDJ6_9TELE
MNIKANSFFYLGSLTGGLGRGDRKYVCARLCLSVCVGKCVSFGVTALVDVSITFLKGRFPAVRTLNDRSPCAMYFSPAVQMTLFPSLGFPSTPSYVHLSILLTSFISISIVLHMFLAFSVKRVMSATMPLLMGWTRISRPIIKRLTAS